MDSFLDQELERKLHNYKIVQLKVARDAEELGNLATSIKLEFHV